MKDTMAAMLLRSCLDLLAIFIVSILLEKSNSKMEIKN
jgi:hypothetical protein